MRFVLVLLALALLGPMVGSVAATEEDCRFPAEGALQVVAFAPALQPGSADLIDLRVGAGVHDLCGLVLSDGEGTLTFSSVPVTPGETVRLLSAADLVVPGLGPNAQTLVWSAEGAPVTRSGHFALAKGGDQIMVNASGRVLDAVVYGSALPESAGWDGASVESSRIERRIYHRGSDANGPVDTDGAADWAFPRIYRQHQTDRPSAWSSVQGEVRAFVCPDRCYEEYALRVASARERVDINLYDLSMKEAVDPLVEALGRGVTVRVLLHGSPVGASSAKMDRIAWSVDTLVAAGAEVRTLEGLRFDVNHAKYLVVDSEWSVVFSENANAHGWPPDGMSGNRGWGIAVQDAQVAAWLGTMFADDFLHPEDARAVTGNDLNPDAQPPRWAAAPVPAEGRLPTLVRPAGADVKVRPVVAPDHLGDPGSSPLVAALRGATDEIWLQQLNLPWEWNRRGHEMPSPLIGALAETAERGVAVRGTLAGDFEDGDVGTPGNDRTSALLMSSLGADVRLGGAPGDGLVHNKGWLVDPTPSGRGLAVVGSANGNLASQTLNREVTLFVEDPEVAAYYRSVLAEDLERAGGGTLDAVGPGAAGALPTVPFVWVVCVFLFVALVLRRGPGPDA